MSDQKCPKTGPRRCQAAPGALGARLAGPETCRRRHGTLHGTIEGPQGEHRAVRGPRFAVTIGARAEAPNRTPTPRNERPPRNKRHTLNT